VKIKCPVCNRRFRHYYLWISHVQDTADNEDRRIINKEIKYGAHIHVLDKILSKCNEKLKKLI